MLTITINLIIYRISLQWFLLIITPITTIFNILIFTLILTTISLLLIIAIINSYYYNILARARDILIVDKRTILYPTRTTYEGKYINSIAIKRYLIGNYSNYNSAIIEDYSDDERSVREPIIL